MAAAPLLSCEWSFYFQYLSTEVGEKTPDILPNTVDFGSFLFLFARTLGEEEKWRYRSTGRVNSGFVER